MLKRKALRIRWWAHTVCPLYKHKSNLTEKKIILKYKTTFAVCIGFVFLLTAVSFANIKLDLLNIEQQNVNIDFCAFAEMHLIYFIGCSLVLIVVFLSFCCLLNAFQHEIPFTFCTYSINLR